MKSLWKKTAAVIIAAGMVAACSMPALAQAQEKTPETSGVATAYAVEAPLSGPCGDGLTFAFDPETGVLTITGEGDMWDFDGDLPWAQLTGSIQKIVVSTGVIRISGGAFSGCASLEAVELPQTLAAIDTGAFSGCENLTAVDLSATSVETIGASAFDGCTSLETVALPQTLTTVEAGAFSGCENLTAVDLSATSVETFGASAFDG